MRKSALCVLWLSLILLLSVIPGPHVSTANANNTSKMGPTLGFLLTIREQDIEVPPESELWDPRTRHRGSTRIRAVGDH